MADMKTTELPPKTGLVIDGGLPYPIVVQYFRPEGIEIKILSPGKLNMRKIETAMLQTARKLRLMRAEEVREQNKLEQVVTTVAEAIGITKPEEDEAWQQDQAQEPSPQELPVQQEPTLQQRLKAMEREAVERAKISQGSLSNSVDSSKVSQTST